MVLNRELTAGFVIPETCKINTGPTPIAGTRVPSSHVSADLDSRYASFLCVMPAGVVAGPQTRLFSEAPGLGA